MRNYIFIIYYMGCLFCSWSIRVNAQGKSEYFRLPASEESMREIVIDKVFDSNEVLDVFDNTSAIYGLSITMDINRSVDKGLVRILLEDSNGKKYLVAESYKEISNTKKKSKLVKIL